MSIILLNCKCSYKENIEKNYKMYTSVDETMEDLLDETTSTLEVLTSSRRKIYLDIENIPYEQDNLIYEIIDKFTSLINIDKDNYCLTYNSNSTQHAGRSYHVIFPYAMIHTDMRMLIRIFKKLNTDYKNIIDETVYNMKRLFRLPLNGKVTGKGVNNDDKHILLKGNINDAFVQLACGCDYIDKYNNENVKKLFEEHADSIQSYKYEWKKTEPSESALSEVIKRHDLIKIIIKTMNDIIEQSGDYNDDTSYVKVDVKKMRAKLLEYEEDDNSKYQLKLSEC